MNLLITGIGTQLGQAVIARLMRDNPFERVFGISRRPPPLLGPVHFIGADVRVVDLGDLIVMDGVTVVLHLSWSDGPDPGKDEAATMRRLLDIAEPAGLRRVVHVSCDYVYAASERPVPEQAPRRSLEGLGRASRQLVRGKLAVEEAVAGYRAQGGVEVATLRLCPVVGPTRPRVFDAVLDQRPLVGPRDGDPLLQFVHEDDAAEALLAAVRAPDVCGIYNVAGDEPLPLSTVAGILETSVVRAPGWFTRPVLGALAKVGLLPFAPPDAARLHVGVPMATDRCRAELAPMRYSSRQALAVWRVGERPAVLRTR